MPVDTFAEEDEPYPEFERDPVPIELASESQESTREWLLPIIGVVVLALAIIFTYQHFFTPAAG